MAMSSVQLEAQITTVYLVRHAEKETNDSGNRNPTLTEAGRQRALALQEWLNNKSVEAVFSTDYERTRQTAAPTAAAKSLSISLYHPGQLALLADSIKTNYKGKSVLIVGHSNSTLEALEALGGKRPVPRIEESDYDNLFVVTIAEDGKVEVQSFSYGSKTD